jgi:prepilin-type N-terminal cleavage/methylation domain-containing protein
MTRPDVEAREDGFTLIELVMVIAITSFAFLALATMLGGTLKSLSVGKTRAQANELATQGIEDLQRFDYNDLGVCPGAADPSPAVPTSLTGLSPVVLPNCGAGGVVYEEPCTSAGSFATLAVPRQTYVCTRNNVAYRIDRYVMWADAGQTGKRLAVLVSWTDSVGGHQVTQESSLRSPDAASVIGLQPPQLVSVSVAAPNPVLIDTDGTLLSALTFNATTLGVTAADQATVTLDTLTTQPDGTVAALPTNFALTTSDNGATWSTSLPGATVPKFGSGSQYVTFTVVRAGSDGKANSKVASTTLTFCPAAGCPANLPTIGTATVSPSTIDIGTSGVLQSSFTLSAVTANLTTESTVTALINTQTGAASLQLKASQSCVAGGVCNSWSATFAPGSVNLRFLPGGQVFYMTAVSPVTGSSAVKTTNVAVFG